MGLELVIFIASVLFGIFIYWRESNNNGMYRFVNRMLNSKKLQMKATDQKGFVYKQAFLPRLVFITAFFLLIALIIQFLTPIQIFESYNGISAFSSSIVGTLVGTYLASFVLKSGKVIEEKTSSLEDIVHDTIEKGKDFIEEIKTKDAEIVEDATEKTKEEGKSARERLKDKGLL